MLEQELETSRSRLSLRSRLAVLFRTSLDHESKSFDLPWCSSRPFVVFSILFSLPPKLNPRQGSPYPLSRKNASVWVSVSPRRKPHATAAGNSRRRGMCKSRSNNGPLNSNGSIEGRLWCMAGPMLGLESTRCVSLADYVVNFPRFSVFRR